MWVMSKVGATYTAPWSHSRPDHVLWLAEIEPRRVMATVLRFGKRSWSPSHTTRYLSASTVPEVTSVSGAWMPNTWAASSSLPMATSQYCTSSGITSPAFLPQRQSLLR